MARPKKQPVIETPVETPEVDDLVTMRVIVPTVRLGSMRVAYDGDIIRVTEQARASLLFARQAVDHV